MNRNACTLLAIGLLAFGAISRADTPKPDVTASPIQTETLPEIAPDIERPCFAGAIYRKAVSSTDIWDGIQGEVTLPQIEFDKARWSEEKKRYLDNPSIYMGGRSGEQEIDCGITWGPTKDPDGTISTEGRAFRPFWRNETWNMGELKPDLYFYPGDRIRMRCALKEDGKLEMVITLLERAGADKAEKIPPPFRVEFEAASFAHGKMQEFKRVNAIDQVANEGKPVQATKTKVIGAEWQKVVLVRQGKDVPFVPTRYTDMRCPEPQKVSVEVNTADQSGEKIIIDGGK